MNTIYQAEFSKLKGVVISNEKTDWVDFTDEEKLVAQNCVLLVGLLYKMCKVRFVIDDESSEGSKRANSQDIDECMNTANKVLEYIDKEEK